MTNLDNTLYVGIRDEVIGMLESDMDAFDPAHPLYVVGRVASTLIHLADEDFEHAIGTGIRACDVDYLRRCLPGESRDAVLHAYKLAFAVHDIDSFMSVVKSGGFDDAYKRDFERAVTLLSAFAMIAVNRRMDEVG